MPLWKGAEQCSFSPNLRQDFPPQAPLVFWERGFLLMVFDCGIKNLWVHLQMEKGIGMNWGSVLSPDMQ